MRKELVIKWTNRNSGETGYVKDIITKENHFENTFDVNEAKVYVTEKGIEGAIARLNSIGEGTNNDFEAVSKK